MGKKTLPKGEGSPRGTKSPRLDQKALTAAGAPEVSGPMEEGAEGAGDSSRCDHGLTDSSRETLRSSLLSVDPGKCVGCRLEDEAGLVKVRPEKSCILMCLQCGSHFCCGIGGIQYPFGRSRWHALQTQHWVAALYGDAARGHCFKCNAEVQVPVDPDLASGVGARARWEGTGVSKRCNHVPADRAYRGSLSSSSGKCDFCGLADGGTAKIYLCLTCGWQFCPGHLRDHAKQKQHMFAVLVKLPESRFCFKCEALVDVNSGRIQAERHASGIGMVPRPTRGFGSVVPGVMGNARPKAGETATVAPAPAPVDDANWDFAKKCTHIPRKRAYKLMRNSSLLLDNEGTRCEGCQSNPPVGYNILVCLECGRRSCGDPNRLVAHGHARDHAKQEQHWVSVMSSDLQVGICYKCGIGVVMYANTDCDCDSDSDSDLEEEMMDLEEGYVSKGIPNLLNTCYVSAIVQCLLVLDKLRARMLGPDPPPGHLGRALKELFVETSTAHAVEGTLNPNRLLTSVRFHDDKFEVGTMHDSYELLGSLLDALHNEENGVVAPNRQNGAPTVIDTIFRGQLSETRTCMLCHSSSVVYEHFCDLSVALPSEEHPSTSDALPQTSKSLKSQPKKDATQLLPENESIFGKSKAAARSGDSHLLGSELKDVVVEETIGPLEVDSAEAQHIWQSKDVKQDPLPTHEDQFPSFKLSEGFIEVPVEPDSSVPRNMSDVKAEQSIGTTAPSHCPEDCTAQIIEDKGNAQSRDIVYDKDVVMSDSNSVPSIEDCLSLFFKEDIVERSCGCPKVPEEPSTNQSENSDLMAASTNDKTTVDGGQTECHDGIQEAVSSCLPAEKQTNPSSPQHSKILNTPNQDRRNQAMLALSADQLGDNQNEQNRSDRARQISRITKLPPVLTLHLKRYIRDGETFHKNEAYVSYKEYLDVGKFMDSSSMDKDSSLYRLAGVVEHWGGPSINSGHYVAYVRARRPGDQQQQSSCSSSWFLANDEIITEVTLEEVLKLKAYILFYERMEG